MDPVRIFSEHTFPVGLSIFLLLLLAGIGKIFFDRFFKRWDEITQTMRSLDAHIVQNTAMSGELKGSVDRLSNTIQDRRVEQLQQEQAKTQHEVHGLKTTVDRAVTEMREHRDQQSRTPAQPVVVTGMSAMQTPLPPVQQQQLHGPMSSQRGAAAASCG